MALSESAQTIAFVAPTLETVSLFLHIAGGSVGIVAGYTAILAPKGRRLHRAAGTVFMVAMLTMSGFASAMAVAKGQTVNTFAGFATLYLVGTAWLAVKRRGGGVGRLEIAGCLLAAVIAALAVGVGLKGGTDSAGVPAVASLIFGLVMGLGALSDVKVLVQRGVSGAARLSRHLWRMTTALFIATGSFFLGQMDVIPRALHGPHIWVLALAPLALLVFWLIRVRIGPRKPPAVQAPA